MWSNCSSLVERSQNCSSSLLGRGQCVLQRVVERVGQSVLGSSGQTSIPTGQTVAKCSPLILPPSDKGRLLEHCHWQDIGEAGVLGRQWPPLAKPAFWKHTKASA